MKQDRFICDEMLQGLGRLLRASGCDTLIATDGQPDNELLTLARKEARAFITRDRKLLLEHPDYHDIVVLLSANDVPGCVQELSGLLDINWLKAPFMRCLLCNQKLNTMEPDDKAMIIDQVPEDVLLNGQQVLYCPVCQKAFWEGSHVRRMRARLAGFNQGQWL